MIELFDGHPAAALPLFERAVDVGGDVYLIRLIQARWLLGRRPAAEVELEELGKSVREAIDGGSEWSYHAWQLAAIAAKDAVRQRAPANVTQTYKHDSDFVLGIFVRGHCGLAGWLLDAQAPSATLGRASGSSPDSTANPSGRCSRIA